MANPDKYHTPLLGAVLLEVATLDYDAFWDDWWLTYIDPNGRFEWKAGDPYLDSEDKFMQIAGHTLADRITAYLSSR
jgi:hypothetical protein